MKMKSLKAKFAKTASIKSLASTRSFVHDRSTTASKEAAASGVRFLVCNGCSAWHVLGAAKTVIRVP